MADTRPPDHGPRPIRTAEVLAVGSELTNGETRDTNSGELAASLTAAGVSVRRLSALPDDLDLVTQRFGEALGTVDLVVTTGGLGPTPDDLTREGLAAALGEEPTVDPALASWLRAMFRRRGVPLPAVNLKQAWLIPSAISIPNDNGTAPGWWVERPDGRVAVLLPGPPREMRPMWTDWVLPRLRDRGLGDGRLVRTLRTYGVGESTVVERLGEDLLRRDNPVVATYARADWLDIRISAVDRLDDGGRTVEPAGAILESAAARVREALEGHVWAEGETTWARLVAEAAATAGVRLAAVEAGTSGQLEALLGDVPALVRDVAIGPAADGGSLDGRLAEAASQTATEASVEVGLALVARPDGPHTLVRAAVARADASWSKALELRLFVHGPYGRARAAIAAAAFLTEALREMSGESEPRGTTG